MPATPTRILIIANRTAATQRLLNAVEGRAAEAPCTFTLLVPDVAHVRDADWTLDTARRLLSKAARAAVGGLAGGAGPAAGGPGRAGGRTGPVRGCPGGGRHRRVRRNRHLDAAARRVEVAAARSRHPRAGAR